MSAPTFSLDFETTSACDIARGAYRYASCPSTRILLFAIAEDDKPPVVWRIDAPDSEDSIYAKFMLSVAVKEGAPIRAFNVGFEAAICKYVLERQLGIKPPALEQWRCTQFLCRRSGAPPSLAKAAEFLKLGDQKNPIGKALIGVFSDQNKKVDLLPPKGDLTDKEWKKLKRTSASPILEDEIPWDWTFSIAGGRMTVREAWEHFIAYCRQDVVVEREVARKLAAFEPSPEVLAGFQFDLRMNDRGVPVDLPTLRKVQDLIVSYEAELSDRFRELTGLNPSQTAAALKWLKSHGYAGDSLNAATVADVRKKHYDQLDAEGREALDIRVSLSFAAVKKVPAMMQWVCPDNRIRGAFTFYGAQKTGRWTSQGPQFQNMKKPGKKIKKLVPYIYSLLAAGKLDNELVAILFGNPYEIYASLSRYFVRIPGQKIYDVDFAQVEARILPALIGCERILDKFRRGEDIYMDVANALGVDRDMGKVISLLCIAEGELVLTDQGLVPIESVTTDMRVWDGVEWVRHEGVVCKGVREVLLYDGLKATPDHEVYVVNVLGDSTIVKMSHQAAMEKKLPLVRSGHAARPISASDTRRMKFKGLKFQGAIHTSVATVYDILNAGPRHRFTVSGKLVSNCQFQGGWRAVKVPLGDKITEADARKAVAVYRKENPEVVEAWDTFQNTWIKALREPGRWHQATEKVKFAYSTKDPFPRMLMRLPAGRDIVYPYPKAQPITMVRFARTVRVEVKKEGDQTKAYEVIEEVQKSEWLRLPGHLEPAVCMMHKAARGWQSVTGHFHTHELEFWGHVKDAHWGTVKTYGGDLLQSATQGTGMDFLLHGCVEAERRGHEPFFVVHDQALGHHAEGRTLEDFIEALCTRPAWFPDFPLDADGSMADSYQKD
jgi:DNA polymerase